MPCVNCGGSDEADQYVLAFERESGETKVLELELCSNCLPELLADPWVSRRDR